MIIYNSHPQNFNTPIIYIKILIKAIGISFLQKVLYISTRTFVSLKKEQTMERKLASIQKILNVVPIEGADRIEVVSILG